MADGVEVTVVLSLPHSDERHSSTRPILTEECSWFSFLNNFNMVNLYFLETPGFFYPTLHREGRMEAISSSVLPLLI